MIVDTKEELNEWWLEEFGVDVDASKYVDIRVPAKTYAMLVQIGVFNIHGKGISDWARKVGVEAINISTDFSVEMLLKNYQAIKMAVMLKEYPFRIGYKQQADKIWNNILQHLRAFNPEDAEELKNKLFKRRVA
jgi:hypothetical protein